MEKKDLKERILNLSKDWFIEKGYKSLKTDDLANELGVSKRTIYSMFSSKDEMLIEALSLPIIEFENKMNILVMEMINSDNSTYFQNLKEIWELIIQHSSIFTTKFENEIKKYLPQYYITCSNHISKRFENMRNVIESGQDRGYLKKEINVEVFISTMHFTMSNILKQENLSRLPLKVEDVVKQVFTIVFIGAMTPQAVEKFNKTIQLTNL